MYHGEEFIKEAEERYKTVATGGIPENIEEVCIEEKEFLDGMPYPDLLTKSGIVPSKSEARRMIEQNGISINGKKENDINKKFEISDFKDGFLVIQKGKKQFKRIIIKGN